MAAGLGFKNFNTGEVLTSADVNGYLMQGVLVFASEAARDAAITSPQEGQFAYTKDNNSLWYYTGSAWAASGATGDIEGVTAGTGISGGGTSGTVTITNSMATEIDAKGDLVVGTGADTFARLAVGTNGHTLVADSAETTGLKWAAPGGALAIAEIASGSLTSGTQLQLSSLTSYDTLLLRVNNLQWATSADSITMTINNSSSSVYDFMVGAMYAQANYVSYEQGTTRTKIDMTAITVKRDSTDNQFQLLLTNCKSTGFTNFELQCVMRDSGNFNAISVGRGIFKSAAAVSTLEFRTENNRTFSAGSYVLWGA